MNANYGKNKDPNRNKTNYENCLIYVQRTWPDESEEEHVLRAEAVYEISKVFFDEILPKIINRSLTPSDN